MNAITSQRPCKHCNQSLFPRMESKGARAHRSCALFSDARHGHASAKSLSLFKAISMYIKIALESTTYFHCRLFARLRALMVLVWNML